MLGLEKESLDLDFSVSRGAIDFGRRLANKLKAGFVILDRENGCSRVVFKDKKSNRTMTFDFVDFRGATLKEDLLKRDFTINTLAAKIPFDDQPLIDCCGACSDLKKRIVRHVGVHSFDDDALRILRAFSLSAIHKFRIFQKTLELIKKKKESLRPVAGERMRDELFKILNVDRAWSTITLLDELHILEIVIPQVRIMHQVRQGAYHHLDVWGHSLETLKKIEELIDKLKNDKDIVKYLDEEMSGGRKRRQLIKMAALLHDIGKPQAYEVKAGKTMFHGHERIGRIICDEVVDKLKLSTREKFALDTIIFWHLRPGYLADNKILSARAIHRYFRDTKEEALSVLLVSIADQRATRGPMATAESRLRHEHVSFSLIKKYFEMLKAKPFKRLINGNDLIKKLKLPPGPLFSTLLNSVEEAQAAGEVTSKTEALALAKKLVEEGKAKGQKVSAKRSGASPKGTTSQDTS